MKQHRLRSPSTREWVGGLVGGPSPAPGAEEPSPSAEVFIWQVSKGSVVGVLVTEPGDLVPQIIEHFRKTTTHPLSGPAHVPSQVRVASPELAEKLQGALGPRTKVICAPTPELDELATGIRDAFGGAGEPSAPSYLRPGISPEMLAGFFRAAAAVYRAAPWKVLPAGGTVSVSVASLGLMDLVLTVVGQKGSTFAGILFRDWEDYELFLDAAELAAEGGTPKLPPHWALNFDRASDLAPTQIQQVVEHGWEIAEPRAYPSLEVADREGAPVAPSPKDLALVEAVFLALSLWVRAEPRLGDIWDVDDSAIATAIQVTTHAGPMEVHLEAPYPSADSVDEMESHSKARPPQPTAPKPASKAKERAAAPAAGPSGDKAKPKPASDARRKGH